MAVLQKSSDFKSNAYFTKNPAETESEEVNHVEIINIKRDSQTVGDTEMTAISSGGGWHLL